MKEILKASFVVGLFCVCMAVLLCVPRAQAAIGTPGLLQSTNAPGAVIASTNQIDLTTVATAFLQFNTKGTTAADTNAMTWTLQKSNDQTLWASLATWTITPSGTTQSSVVTNINPAAGFLRLIGPDNSGGNGVVTTSVYVVKKPGL